jgi:DNA polymerase (family 10)
MRETTSVIEIAKKNKLPKLIQPEDVRSIIHSHSKWSDGTNTLEEMAEECIKRGMNILLSPITQSSSLCKWFDRRKNKRPTRQIDQLNEQYKPFKIFKSIECDILGMAQWIIPTIYFLLLTW